MLEGAGGMGATKVYYGVKDGVTFSTPSRFTSQKSE